MVHRSRFTLREKARIIGEQDRLGLSLGGVCRRYDIQRSTLQGWRMSLENARYISKNRKCVHSGNRSQYFEQETTIRNYILGRRHLRAIVTVRSIIAKLVELCPAAEEKSYKSRQMWTYRFINRNRFSIRRITRNVTLNDDEIQRRRLAFLGDVEQQHARRHDTIFVNMDQVSVVYGDAGRFTVNERGASSVQVRSGFSPADRATVALAVASNGEKLHPLVVFKGTQNGRVAREFSRTEDPYPSGIHYMTNQNAWMTEQVMLEWIQRVLMPFTWMRGAKRICLILDSFQVHRTENVRSFLSDNGIRVIYIPGGMTGDLQPLDVGINGPFKHYIHETVFNRNNFESLTASNKRLSISRSISTAFSRITEDTIINSFNRVLFTTYGEINDADEIDVE